MFDNRRFWGIEMNDLSQLYRNGQKYEITTSSKGIRTLHHKGWFLRWSLVLKIYPNTGQRPGTTAEVKKKNMAKFEA